VSSVRSLILDGEEINFHYSDSRENLLRFIFQKNQVKRTGRIRNYYSN